MKNRIISAVIAAIMLIFAMPVYAAEGYITSFSVDTTGKAEVIGFFDETDSIYSTLLMTDGSEIEALSNSSLIDHVMYINQQELGNNGAFYYQFQIDEKFSNSPYTLKLQGGAMIEKTGVLGELPSEMENVANNAIRIGNDIYDVGCSMYTIENISQSIQRGGNILYYKIGDKWYNLLDKNATSSTFFNSENAVSYSEWSKWSIDTYYHY